MVTSQDWLDEIDKVRYNPTGMMRVTLNAVESNLDGTATIGSSTMPVVQAFEAAAVNAAACMIDNLNNLRKQYPSMAMDFNDLYIHMSDVDYIDRFAIPTRASIQLWLNRAEVFARVVPTDVPTMKKLVIPRHTRFEVNSTPFTMQYPIEIRVMSHGGLQIVYDNTRPSPLQTLQTNLVDWEIVSLRAVEYVVLHIPVGQFEIESKTGTANQTSSFVKTWPFKDQFYYARAYYSDRNNVWREMITTHSDQSPDPLKPTALLKVVNNTIQMAIPQIYQTTGQVSGQFRLDVYTTKGPLEISLGDYGSSEFVANWIDLEDPTSTVYFKELTAFADAKILSDSVVTGGRSSMTFEDLRERVMSNSTGPQDLPISNAQITYRLSRLGYDLVKNIDHVTNRQFLATRTLPPPINGSVSSGASCSIQPFITSMALAAALPTASNNGNRVTLLPSTLYSINSGVVQIMPKTAADAIMALPIDVRARRINEGQYLYSPFHYVLDSNNDQFEHRPYFLDGPRVLTKSFIDENETTGIQVSAQLYSVDRTETGYDLTVVVKSSDSWKTLPDAQTFCQLAFIPTGQQDRAYLNGELLGLTAQERTYIFRIDTNYDLDEEDSIFLTTFSMYDDGPRPHPAGLTTKFEIIFAASGLQVDGLQSSNIDLEMGVVLLPEDAIGISREALTIELGVPLHGLWAAARTMASSQDYERYDADVPATYPDTIFVRNPDTGTIVFEDDGQGGWRYQVLHAKGDPMLDGDNNPIFAYRKGDVRLDGSGQPIIKSPRTLLRQLDMLFVDGVYWFADQAAAVAYKTTIPQTLVGWLKNDIEYLSQYLLEETSLFFYPKATLGSIQAIIREDQRTTLSALQSFQVDFYLTAAAYRDADLRLSLTQMAIDTIAEDLRGKTVTMDGIVSRLRAKAGNDIVSVAAAGLGGSSNLAVVSLSDDSARLSIRKSAVALADGTVGVEDDVVVSFFQHIS